MRYDTVTLGDLTFPDNPAILKRIHKRSIRRGNYERPERLAMKGLLEPTDHVLEIGGGIGFISTLMVREHGVARVRSFDANPDLIPFIQEVHKLNSVADRIDVRHGLIAAQEGPPLTFFVREDFLASSLNDNLGDRFGGVVKTVDVEQVTLESILDDFPANLLICDIEGAEADLLPALDLSTFRAAIVELHPQTIGLAGVKKVFEAFMSAGLVYDAARSEQAVVTFQKA
ncbi:FkbM family methyltransferase [Ruegeria arenilitoris]|uniref:FkbM family methyltransferase n=1 Tax=Ruegeria arenilitoris TaxID=1173585 RepID=UPI00148090A7|nr:FkbM family methyltransferase [Ruegeria arenilitoris]